MTLPHDVFADDGHSTGQVIIRNRDLKWTELPNIDSNTPQIVIQRRGEARVLVTSGAVTIIDTSIRDIDAIRAANSSSYYQFVVIPFPLIPDVESCPVQLWIPDAVYELSPTVQPPTQLVFRSTEFNSEEWERRVANAQATLPKTVLSRTITTDTFQPTADAINGLFNSEINSNHIWVKLNRTDGFVSLSPERLFWADQDHVFTEAIAGTMPNASAGTLTTDSKSINEHDWVVNWITRQLRSIGLDPKSDDVELLQLSNVSHRKTAITAQRNGLSISELLTALYPTPAVAGYPRDAAISSINSMEPNRGYYAGLLGIVTPNDVEFIVLIRFLAYSPDTTVIRTGAGIVAESNPVDEWSELDAKAALFGRFP